MTWLLSGDPTGLFISATAPLIRGACALDTSFVADPANPESDAIAKTFRRMKAASAEWRLLPASALPHVLGLPHAELHKRAAAEGAMAEVSCSAEGTNGLLPISFNIVLPEATFQRAYAILSAAFFGSSRCAYLISIGFVTFRRPSAEVDLPTLTDFLSGQPYFSNDVSIAVQSAGSAEA